MAWNEPGGNGKQRDPWGGDQGPPDLDEAFRKFREKLGGALSGVIGTLAGVAFGLLIAFNVGTLVAGIEALLRVSFLPSSVYLISRMPSDPQAGDIVPIIVISLLLAFIATLYPSWRASRVQPSGATS